MNVGDGVFTHHNNARHFARYFSLHIDERVPAANCSTLEPRLGVFHFQLAIFGNRVVQRDDGGNLLFNFENSVTQALVVVYEIKIVYSLTEFVVGANAESTRLAKCSFQELCCLNKTWPVFDLPIRRESTGVLIVKNVKAWQLVQWNARIKNWVWLTTKHFNMVTKISQCFGEMSCVDALSANMRLSSVGEVGNAQRAVGIKRRRHKAFSLPVSNFLRQGGKSAFAGNKCKRTKYRNHQHNERQVAKI